VVQLDYCPGRSGGGSSQVQAAGRRRSPPSGPRCPRRDAAQAAPARRARFRDLSRPGRLWLDHHHTQTPFLLHPQAPDIKPGQQAAQPDIEPPANFISSATFATISATSGLVHRSKVERAQEHPLSPSQQQPEPIANANKVAFAGDEERPWRSAITASMIRRGDDNELCDP
jgi:hypothetical protein